MTEDPARKRRQKYRERAMAVLDIPNLPDDRRRVALKVLHNLDALDRVPRKKRHRNEALQEENS